MAKKSTRKKVVELWPGKVTVSHAIIALSLMLNIALVAVLIALAQTNIFDDQIVDRGAEIICSEDYQQQAATADSRVQLQYTCAHGNARPYFLGGYNDYRESLGLKPVTQ
jgi:hypothetical protein